MLKKIIIVAKHMGDGGAERVLCGLIREWIINNIDVSVVMFRPDLCQNDYNIDSRIHIIKMPIYLGPFCWLKRIHYLIKLFKKENKSIVLAFIKPAIFMVCLASFFVKNKIIISERCDPKQSPNTPFLRFCRDLLFLRASYCVFQTEDAKHHFYNSIIQKSTVIPNPINPNLLQIPRYEGIRRKTIVTAARLSKQKNLPLLIKAFSKFIKNHPDYTLEIYGRGELEKELSILINNLGLQKNVFLMGFSNNIYQKILDCTMYVSSSDYEGISNSMLEALGLGLPVIATDCPAGGTRMAIENNVNGLLIPVGDEEALYLAMRKIVEEKGLIEKLSKEAFKIRFKYPIESVASKWLELF